MKRAAAVAAILIAWAALSAAAADAPLDPAVEQTRVTHRLAEIRRQVARIDHEIAAGHVAADRFAALQDLRTNLEQERKVLEERQRLVRASTQPVSQPVPASSAPARSLWESGGWARFEGLLPCAGCEGIRTSLTLYNDGLRYTMTERYEGPSAPKREFSSEGLWTTLRGQGDDPDATVFELDYDKPGRERHFLRLGDDEIKLLDLDESKLKKKPNLILKRVAP